MANGRLVWLLQRPDQIFVDLNADVLCEGLARVRADRSKYKAVHLGPWGAALNLLRHVEPPPFQRGAYAVSRLTFTEPNQVVNWRWLHYLVDDVDWKGARVTSFGDLLRHRRLTYTRAAAGTGAGGAAAASAEGDPRMAQPLHLTDQSLHALYVPLRELCRSFEDSSSFSSSNTPTEVRALSLPSENGDAPPLTSDPAALSAMMRANERWGWAPSASSSAVSRGTISLALPEVWVLDYLQGNGALRG